MITIIGWMMIKDYWRRIGYKRDLLKKATNLFFYKKCVDKILLWYYG